MADKEIYKRIEKLALEIRAILKANAEDVFNDTEAGKVALKKSGKIKYEIESLGFAVTATIEREEGFPAEFVPVVTLYEPKKEMSSDEEKLYDQWFMNLKPPKDDDEQNPSPPN